MSVADALEHLLPQVGTETSVGSWLAVDQDRINRFADATGDHQWIHTDVERAQAESPFGSTVAHGYLTLSLIPGLTGLVGPDRKRFSGTRLVINYGLNRVRFPAPVPAGARVRARMLLQSVEETKNGLLVTEQVTVEIEGGAKPGCVAERLTLYLF